MQEKALQGPKFLIKFEINSSKNNSLAIYIFEINQVNGNSEDSRGISEATGGAVGRFWLDGIF